MATFPIGTPIIPTDGWAEPATANVGDTIRVYGRFLNTTDEFQESTWNHEIAGFGGRAQRITMDPGENSTRFREVIIPSGLTSGMYAISIYVGDVSDTYPLKLEVIGAEPPPEPEPTPAEISILNILLEPNTGKVGEEVRIRAGFQNTGGTSFTGTWNFEIEGLSGSHQSITIGPNSTKYGYQYLLIPETLTPGKYAISLYILDLYKTFPEVLEIISGEVEEPAEGWVDWFITKVTENFSAALTLFSPLLNSVKDIILVGMLATETGRNLLESWAEWLGNKLIDDYPEFEALRDAPKGSLSIVAILGIAMAILGVGTVVGWLRKELPEPAGMAVWALIEAKEWEAANTANQKYIEFIWKANNWVLVMGSWLNPIIAQHFNTNRDSQLASAAGYQTIIDAGLAEAPDEGTITLTITSTPSGAKIYIDNVFKFEYTNTTIIAPAGAHTLTLKLSGYKDHNLPYDWPAGSEKTLQVDLQEYDPEDPMVEQPADEVVIPLVPAEGPTFNSWAVTINGVDSVTGDPVAAWILIDDVFKGVTTPAVFYLAPESTFNIKLRLSGYMQGEVTYSTQPLPTA